MIHYSSIKDAWGKKDMFKNNIPSGKFTNIYESASNCQASLKSFEKPFEKPVDNSVQPSNPPETFAQKDSTNPQQNVNYNEHFTGNNCAFMEHLQNCPFCMAKFKNSITDNFTENFTNSIKNQITEHFADPTTSTSPQVDKPISTINLFGLEINITKDVLKVLFIIILIIIFILLLRMVNVTFKKTDNKYLNMPNNEMLRLMTQMKYFNPTI